MGEKWRRWFLCFVLAATALLSINAGESEAATGFNDIGSNHPLKTEIDYLNQGGIVLGDKGRFDADSKINRAQFTAMLGRALELDDTKRKTSFTDVDKTNFASGLIESAAKLKIIAGTGNGRFEPDRIIKRGEMALIIARAFKYPFDGSSSGAATALLSRGIADRLSDNSFGTDRPATRGEMAMFLARAINYELRVSSQVEQQFTSVKYTTDSLNIRKGPSTKYAVSGTLKKDSSVSIAYQVGDWLMVKSEAGTTGFVSGKYLSGVQGAISGGDDGETPPATNPGNTNPGVGTGKSISSQFLVIDPGHGGVDPGSVNDDGIKEKDIVLTVGLLLKDMLAQVPFKEVYYTRTTDISLPTPKRPGIVNALNADTFVSIHANKTAGGYGTETLYYWSGKRAAVSNNTDEMDGKKLAEFIQTRLVSMLGTRDRGIKIRNDLLVLNSTNMPAVLAELGFIDDKNDVAKLTSPTYQRIAAKALFYGILDYYNYKGFNVTQYYKIQ